MNTDLPNLPWKKVTTDLLYWKGSTCLLIVDYYSRYIKIGNRLPYSPCEYKQFATKYGFTHTTSSPRYLQSTREAERAMKTIKSLLTNDISFYATSYSSSELLMKRGFHTTWSISENQLEPSISEWSVCENETVKKANSKKNFDACHRANSYSRSIASRATNMDIGEER